MAKHLPTIKEPLDELSRQLKAQSKRVLSQRIHLLWLVATESVSTRQEAARALNLHVNTVSRWLLTYERQGFEGVLGMKRRGRQEGEILIMPEAALDALKTRLKGQGFESFGEIRTWLRQEWGVECKYSALWHLVRKRWGAKLKRSRPSHPNNISPMPSPHSINSAPG